MASCESRSDGSKKWSRRAARRAARTSRGTSRRMNWIEATPGRSARAAVRRASRWRARRAEHAKTTSRAGFSLARSVVRDARRSNQGARSASSRGSPRDIFARASGACRSSPSTNAGGGRSGDEDASASRRAAPTELFPQPEGPISTHARAPSSDIPVIVDRWSVECRLRRVTSNETIT